MLMTFLLLFVCAAAALLLLLFLLSVAAWDRSGVVRECASPSLQILAARNPSGYVDLRRQTVERLGREQPKHRRANLLPAELSPSILCWKKKTSVFDGDEPQRCVAPSRRCMPELTDRPLLGGQQAQRILAKLELAQAEPDKCLVKS